METSKSFQKLIRRGSNFLNCQYPIMCGAMTWISEPKLVSAVSNNGGFGCLAGGNAPVDILIKNIEETRSLTDNSFAVNLITIAPAYHEHLAMLKDQRLPYVIFAGSFPRDKEIAIAKASGAKVLCFASTESIAERMIRYGADGLILEGSEAGGHIGHVSTTILLQQVLFKFGDKLPVFVAGGMGTGKLMAHVMLMGAAGVQLGTRFVMTKECNVHQKFKDVFMRANARDAISTPQYDSKLPVVAVRALKNKGMQKFGELQLQLLLQMKEGKIGREQAQEEVEKYWIGSLRRAAIDGDIEAGSLMAGQSVGLLEREMTIKELITELVTDADCELIRLKSFFAD
ncbi:MAG: hypothetical protein GX280_05635 [Lentisphaerae bacterium]|nr:nitronate monooxygenase family protein [Victivallaceae bacterium]MDD5663440.1 nitronate monooxygenase family protein [Victivallaceae bacterium]NLK83550.1 hypothetical protein [Lentisphaerota bacterium]